ncbi:MAG: regulatory protein RecX [Bacteroidota bacterium]
MAMDYPEKKPVKITDPDIAYAKAQSYCAYQERCQQEVRDKLYSWGLWPDAVENIIARLITENYINEERFARAFAGGKFRIKKWGRVKIRLELRKRKISEYCIRQAMKEIDGAGYLAAMKKILTESGRKYKGLPKEARKRRIAAYLISRGYESDLVWELIGSQES